MVLGIARQAYDLLEAGSLVGRSKDKFVPAEFDQPLGQEGEVEDHLHAGAGKV